MKKFVLRLRHPDVPGGAVSVGEFALHAKLADARVIRRGPTGSHERIDQLIPLVGVEVLRGEIDHDVLSAAGGRRRLPCQTQHLPDVDVGWVSNPVQISQRRWRGLEAQRDLELQRLRTSQPNVTLAPLETAVVPSTPSTVSQRTDAGGADSFPTRTVLAVGAVAAVVYFATKSSGGGGRRRKRR